MELAPILPPDLDEVARFLHENLSARISQSAWVSSLTHQWALSQPNHGMLLRVDGQIVGALCAIYSDQVIDGKLERFCNPHSWCVLDKYRHASMSLVLAVIKQRDYHFTMFTPNPKVAQVFSGLRFRLLDDALLYFPNLPKPWASCRDRFVESRIEYIAACLEGAALAEFEAHRSIPWLRFVAFGSEGDSALVIYKPGRWKKLPCALLAHVSDPSAIQRHGHILQRHLLNSGLLVSRIEARLLSAEPPLAYRTRRSQPKLVSSRSLDDSRIRDIYSELMALDI